MLKLIEISQDGRPRGMTPLMGPETRNVLKAYKSLYETVPYEHPWIGYLVESGGDLVGSCGFKGPPVDGRVEIAYYTYERFERRGFGSWMGRQLLAIARDANPSITVLAQTEPYESPSTLILRKAGFQRVSILEHPTDGTVWEWHYMGSAPDVLDASG
jgi:RimJ/RimL family protein N-acetyltransferase